MNSNEITFYDLNEDHKKLMLEASLGNKGKCCSLSGGLCGEIYVFDQGENVYPRYVCAKVPKRLGNASQEDTAKRFVNELERQLSFSRHMFVHWPFDFTEVMGVPVALFRYWESDLDKLLKDNSASDIQKLSIMIYTCVGLRYCYKNGLIAHQDLKPANIFLRDVKKTFSELANLDIYNIALIADFGLSNAASSSNIFDGTRPYMAPEQWNKEDLSAATDVFAIGVILYELMSGGYHPVGIKLQDYWPSPKEGNSKKWTREDSWRKWVTTSGCKIENSSYQLSRDLLILIQGMLSLKPRERPSIDEVISLLLRQIHTLSNASHEQVEFLVSYFDTEACSDPLEQQWPYLSERWKQFSNKFG